MSWGMSVPKPRVEPVFFPNDHLPVLRQAADFLAETQSREDFELEGYITKLARDKQTEGDVTIAATVDGQLLKVLVRLPPGQYKVAADAHTADHKVSVMGELGKEGRQYRLADPRHLRVIVADEVEDG